MSDFLEMKEIHCSNHSFYCSDYLKRKVQSYFAILHEKECKIAKFI